MVGIAIEVCLIVQLASECPHEWILVQQINCDCRNLDELMSCLTCHSYKDRRKRLGRFGPLLDLFARPQLYGAARFESYNFCPSSLDDVKDTTSTDNRYSHHLCLSPDCHLSLCPSPGCHLSLFPSPGCHLFLCPFPGCHLSLCPSPGCHLSRCPSPGCHLSVSIFRLSLVSLSLSRLSHVSVSVFSFSLVSVSISRLSLVSVSASKLSYLLNIIFWK